MSNWGGWSTEFCLTENCYNNLLESWELVGLSKHSRFMVYFCTDCCKEFPRDNFDYVASADKKLDFYAHFCTNCLQRYDHNHPYNENQVATIACCQRCEQCPENLPKIAIIQPIATPAI